MGDPDDQVKRYKKKQMGAYVFMGLQVFFIAVGVMDILIANSVAHSAEYGYDHSMYLFFLSGFCMIVLALFGIAGAMKKVWLRCPHGSIHFVCRAESIFRARRKASSRSIYTRR
eukprot:SAG25_NODE_371_length_9000_cov_6.528480_3_plen_114_part_00